MIACYNIELMLYTGAMSKKIKVGISCSICDPLDHGQREVSVPKKSGVSGVPGSYAYAGEHIHKKNQTHKVEAAFGKNRKEAVVSGRLEDFTHGKDHNEA